MKTTALLIATCTLSGALFLAAQQPPAPTAAGAPPAKPAPPTATPTAAPPVTAAQPVTAPPPERNIRFQFENMPYMEAIERFAQMADKPLLADTNLQGTLSFNDSQAYSYAEALDTLNIILSMKDAMLVEVGRYLRLVPFKKLPQMPLRVFRGLDKTGDVRPGEIVTVVLDLKNLDAAEIAEAVSSMLSNAGSVAPLSRSRGLILTDRLSNIQRIKQLLAEIDTESAVQRQMKSFTLLHASGAVVADLINRTFGVATAPKRTQFNAQTKNLDVLPPDPNDYATAVFDDASRTLVLFGPRDRVTLAEELIARFEDKETHAGEVRIYYPIASKPDELARMLRQAVPGIAAPEETAAAASTKARLIVDTATNRLIVSAPAATQLDAIENFVRKIDGSTSTGGPVARSETVQVTRIFRSRLADPSSLAKILNEAVSKRSPSGSILPLLNVTVDSGSQSVVVTGSPGDVQHAATILSQLEASNGAADDRQTRFIDLGSATAVQRLSPLVEQLYRSQVGDSPALAQGKIIPDAESGRLIVTASKDHLDKIETIVTQLRNKESRPPDRRLEIVPLRNVTVDAALKSITELVAERMTDRRFQNIPKPLLLPDPSNNRLLVTASEDQLKEIAQVVQVVDVAPESGRRTMTLLPLTSKPASELIPLVTQLLAQTSSAAPADAATAPKLMPDSSGRQIIVLATPNDTEKIQGLVQRLDSGTATTAARQFRGIELFGRTAAELQPLVTQLYAEQIKGLSEPAGGAATMIPEIKANRIMVSGSEKEIARVETIIRQLDPAGRAGGKEETRVLRLRTALATEIAGLVEKSLNGQREQVKVLVDSRSNSLVVSGDGTAVEAAAQIVQQLDARPDLQPRELRIIELKSAAATTVAPMLNELFTEMIREQRGANFTSQTKIVPDAAANRIIVTGVKEELNQVATLVDKLDAPPEQGGGARVFKLMAADAALLAPVVSNAMVTFDGRNAPIPRVTVSADLKSNSLVVSGSRSDLQDVSLIIQKLDTGEGRVKSRALRIIDVTADDPTALADLAAKVFQAQNPNRAGGEEISITAEPSGKRIIVLAPENRIDQVEKLVTALDQKPDSGPRDFQLITLRQANAAELLPTINRIYTEKSRGQVGRPAVIFPDAQGNRLAVLGSKEQFATIEEIVKTLQDLRPLSPRQTKVFDLGRLAEAQRLQPLAEQLYRDYVKSEPQLGPSDAQILSDGRTGRLIVSARADHLAKIEEIITQLRLKDVGLAGRQTRTFDVGPADEVQRVLPLVQQLYQDQWKDKGDNDPADAQFLPDNRAGRLIVSGRPAHLERIESLLKDLTGGAVKVAPVETRVFNLKTSSAVELATTVRTLYQEQTKNRPGTTAAQTLILPDAAGNRLIVSAGTSELPLIEALINQLDQSSTQTANTRAFQLKNAQAESVASILSTALVRIDPNGRPIPRVSASADKKSNTLIVSGEPSDLQSIAIIIEQLDSNTSTAAPRSIRMIPVRSGTAGELAGKVRALYQDQVKAHPDSVTAEALILEDAASNQLILAGTSAQIDLLQTIAGQLQEAQGNAAVRETRTLEVGQADEVTRLLPLLQQLYQDQRKGSSEPADAQLLPDTQNGRIIATGRKSHLDQLQTLLTQLRAETGSEGRDTRIYNLAAASAVELAATVKTLYQEQLKTRPVRPANQALILPDAAANRLIISGPTNELVALDDIVRELDQVSAQTAGTRVFKLKEAEAQQVSTILSAALVTLNRNGVSVPRVSVGADNTSNTLIVSGDPKDLQSAAVIIEQLDTRAPREPRQLRILPLKSGLASDLATKVKALYVDQVKALTNSGNADALILGDDSSNRLIVNAGETQLKLIEEIVTQLQGAPEGAARQLRVITLEKSSAASVAAVISQLFAAQVASSDPAQRLVVTAGPGDQTLILDASGPTLAKIEGLVKSMDHASTNGQTVIHTVHLKSVQPAGLAAAVTRTLAGRGQAFAERVSVIPVDGADSVLVEGPPEPVKVVLEIIKQLDEGSESHELEVRIYKVENGNADDASRVIRQLLIGMRRARTSTAPSSNPPTVTVDDRSNSLIIAANHNDFKLIDQILPTLDRASERIERDVQFVWLQNAKAEDVVSKIELVFANRPREERPLVEPDSYSNAITIIGKRSDIAQVESLIKRLDASALDTSIQVRMLPVSRIPAEQMAGMLQNIYPQMFRGQVRVVDKISPAKRDRSSTNAPAIPAPPANPAPETKPAEANQPSVETTKPAAPEVVIAIDKNANALILSGPGHELDQIERLISDLSFSFISSDAEFRQFALKEADPVVVAKTLADLFKEEPIKVQQGNEAKTVVPAPKITIVPEPRTRSVIIRAKPTDFTLLESLIRQLDAEGLSSQLEFRVVPVAHAQPEKLLPLVTQMVNQLNIVRPGEPLTVAVDSRSRGLLLVGRDSVLNQLQRLIQTLDTAPGFAEAEVLIISLKKANASQLASVLQTMLRPGAQGEITAEARELQEQVRRLKVQNDQGQAVTLDLSKPIKIMADPAQGQGGGNRLIVTSTPDNLKSLGAIVEMMDKVPITEGVLVRMLHLTNADVVIVGETLTTIFQQGQRLAAGPTGPAQPDTDTGKALVNPLNVATDRRSNTLLLSGQAESLDLAEKIVKDLDQSVERFLTDVKLFRLKHASAIRLAPLLQSVFVESGPIPGSEGLNTQVTRLRTFFQPDQPRTSQQPKTRAAVLVQADDTSNILIISARSDMLPLIEDVINGLDIPSASGMDTVRVYPLNHADAVAMQKILLDLYDGVKTPHLRVEDKPNITIDDRTNALIVSGNAKAFAFIESLLSRLDTELPIELRDIRIIPLQNADAAAVAASLQRLLDARLTQKPNRQTESLRVLIIGDPRINSLLVGGSKDSFELVETLAKQLDQAAPALSGRIRLVPLANADARTVGSTLINLFNQRYQTAQSADAQRNRPIIVPDPRSNTLLIAAGTEDNKTIDDLLKSLDTKLIDPALTLNVLGLRHNDAAKIAPLLEKLFTDRLRARTPAGQEPPAQEQVTIQPESLNNSLIVSANKDNLEIIKGLLEKIDVQPIVVGGVVEVFTLQFADAQRAAGTLRTLVDQGLYRPGATTPRAQSAREALAIAVDPRSNSLIISASPENLAVVREVIKQIDNKDLADSGTIRLYPLKNARASHLATVLEQFFRSKRTAESVGATAAERSVPVTITPDDRTNTLLITGGKETFEVVERLLQQLDSADILSQTNFRVFVLKQTTANKLQDTLQKLFLRRPSRIKGEPPEPITVVADSWANALIVGATTEDLDSVASLIQRLDAPQTDPGTEVEIFPLAKGDARKIAQTVQSLYRDGGPGTSSPITVNVDERLNALVVAAGEADRKRIAELVKKLDSDSVARVSEIRVFPLQYARAESLSTILNTALNTKAEPLTEQSPNTQSLLQFITRSEAGDEFIASALKERVLITPDPRMNSLIVSAPVDYMSLLGQIVTRLDAQSPQVAKIKVFNLQNADVRQMADVLVSLFRLRQTALPVAGANNSERSVQYTLVRPATPGGVDDEVASATLGTAEENALTVTVDPRTNSLLLGGTDHYVTLASEIIQTLDSSPAQERHTEVYRVRNVAAAEVETALRKFLDQDRQRIAQVLGPEALGTAQRLLDREIAIVAEPVSNTLLLSASPRYFADIKKLIEELDLPQPQVLIQVILAEVTLDKSMELGVEWNYTDQNGNRTIGTGTDFGVAQDLANFGGFSAAITGSDFTFLLRALENDGRLEVLSRPQILTADNMPATINIGQRVPLITDSRVTDQGDTINSFTYQNVGVNLNVTPRISPDGFVKMDVGTTNSALSSSTVDISAGVQVPIINQRLATTTVSVQSGQSIIIGGLISTTDDRRVKKVPFLGNLPLVGVLFRSTKALSDRKELLIVLTPQILVKIDDTGRVIDNAKDVTRDQLDKSNIRDALQRDPLQRQILDPLYPVTPSMKNKK